MFKCPYLEFPPRMKPPVEPVRLLEREAVMGSADIGPDADIEDIAGMTSQNITHPFRQKAVSLTHSRPFVTLLSLTLHL